MRASYGRFALNRQLINNYAKLAAYMVDIIIALLIFTGAYDIGWTSRYDPFIMDYQLEYHQLEAPCPGCAVAVSDCSKIGDYMLIRPLGTQQWVPVIVADCAGADALDENGISWMDAQNILVELSYELAERFGAVDGSIEIEVMR